MVTVATSLDAPIKLLTPKSPTAFAMLGLGDVVVPGLFLALLLRFDQYLAAQNQYSRPTPGTSSEFTRATPFSAVYWYTGVASYVVGLATAMAGAGWSGRAQPALMYLCPACSGSCDCEGVWS